MQLIIIIFMHVKHVCACLFACKKFDRRFQLMISLIVNQKCIIWLSAISFFYHSVDATSFSTVLVYLYYFIFSAYAYKR